MKFGLPRRSAYTVAATALVAVLTAVVVAYAHEGATGIVKERMDAMKSMGDASKAIGKMIKGETVYDAVAMTDHAQTINDHSRDVLDHFPADSLQKASEALPAIWQRWQEFERLAQQLQQSSAELIDVARNDDPRAARRQFARLAKSCKGCHEDFRKKKQ